MLRCAGLIGAVLLCTLLPMGCAAPVAWTPAVDGVVAPSGPRGGSGVVPPSLRLVDATTGQQESDEHPGSERRAELLSARTAQHDGDNAGSGDGHPKSGFGGMLSTELTVGHVSLIGGGVSFIVALLFRVRRRRSARG